MSGTGLEMESLSETTTENEKGISFMEAIERRYADICHIPEDVLILPQNDGNDRAIELVGFEGVSKVQRSLDQLIEVNLSRMNISYCDNECKQTLKSLTQTKTLILSNNLLNSWPEIAKIIKKIPSLTDLVLSHNKLKLPLKEEMDFESFKSLKTLILDNMDYEWVDIEYCGQMWPNIERLDLWGNKITELNRPAIPLFNNLKHLSLCNNDICLWTRVCKLGSLPELKTLNVANCNLTEIVFEDSDFTNKTKLFQQLESLIINNNKLSKWKDIAQLNKLEKLDNLIIKNNPVFDNEKYDKNFNFILARIQNLKFLNREAVTEMVRRDAEIFYLRMFYNDFTSLNTGISDNNENQIKLHQFMSDNPRFEAILSKYGSPFGSQIDSKEEANRKKFLTLNIRHPFDEQKTIEKKLPATISIVNFKAIIRRLFNIDFNYDINLLWTSENFECPLDKETQNLNYYSIENGDTIKVNVE